MDKPYDLISQCLVDNGKVSPKSVLKFLNDLSLNPDVSEIRDGIRKISFWKDEISESDLKGVLASKDEDYTVEDLEIIFDLIAHEGNEYISFDEFSVFMQRISYDFQKDKVALEKMFEEADIDGDGYLSFDEFVRIMLVHINYVDPNKDEKNKDDKGKDENSNRDERSNRDDKSVTSERK